MATDMLDDQEMREAQRDYLDFLDDDVSRACRLVRRFVAKSEKRGHVCWWLWTKKLILAWIYTPIHKKKICAYRL